ncbi:DUF445 family protein [Parashewanella curva]|uniref:DUF445 family protein n=1 Tax=Parashewanella curva TaxID=2338552 RepID=A0A3L8PSK5_9GAMM|nr:DUF445 family protein [Parashewanella curva]RLV58397.1 DUF445 family protein [Parashewanella curva]
MNKSLITNLIASVIFVFGYVLQQPYLFSIGLFALSGAITNWLAIHMLFEKVPGLYGSGVIPARFSDFKLGIKTLVMEQFFTVENIERFVGKQTNVASHSLSPVIKKVNLSPAFDALLETVEKSSFGSMLSMFGGTDALEPLREPFIEKLKGSLISVTESDEFADLVNSEIQDIAPANDISSQVESIVEQRLEELTPEMVKDIIQQMIRKHLGWLVVWGGVFGGLIGLVAQLIS